MILHGRLSNRQWYSIGQALIGSCIALVLLCYRLSGLVPRITSHEQLAAVQAASPHVIAEQPLESPLKFMHWLAMHIPAGSPVLLNRLPSVILGLIVFLLFMRIVTRWYGRRSAIYGLALLGTAAWFLHIARFGGYDIEYAAGILLLLNMHILLHERSKDKVIVYGWLLTNFVLLLLPGFLWFILFSLLLQLRTFRQLWSQLGTLPPRLLVVAATVLGLASLAMIFILHPLLLPLWIGLPPHGHSILQVVFQIGKSYSSLVWHGPHSPELWLGRLPLLDIFQSAMLLSGIIFYARHWRAQRTHLLFGYLIIGGIVVGMGDVKQSVLLPTVYIIITGGIAYLLHFWLRVFPRNPLGRGLGIVMISLIVTLSCFYNLKQYFIAWPHNPETVQFITVK